MQKVEWTDCGTCHNIEWTLMSEQPPIICAQKPFQSFLSPEATYLGAL